jgi:hypothetical protein
MNADDALSRLRAKKAPEPAAPSRGYVTFTGIEAAPEPPVCPECRGRCCRDDLGYPLVHLNWDVGEHWCEHCADGTAPAPVMGLYLLTQTQNKGYDTYDSCVVVAASPEEAKRIHPRGDRVWDGRGWAYHDGRHRIAYWDACANSWVRDIEAVTVTYLGVADASLKPGVVCASFNAG